MQIEYALNAVAAGAPSVGIKASNGVVIATEKKHKSVMYDEHSVHKVEPITKNIGMVYSGMGPDYRYVMNRPTYSNKHPSLVSIPPKISPTKASIYHK